MQRIIRHSMAEQFGYRRPLPSSVVTWNRVAVRSARRITELQRNQNEVVETVGRIVGLLESSAENDQEVMVVVRTLTEAVADLARTVNKLDHEHL